MKTKSPGEAIGDVRAALPERYCDDQVGERIAKRRKQQGITQRDLANVGCSAAYISRVEKGQRVPSMHLLHLMALVLDTSPIYLAWGRGKPEPRAREGRFSLVFLGVPERQLEAAYRRVRELKRARRS